MIQFYKKDIYLHLFTKKTIIKHFTLTTPFTLKSPTLPNLVIHTIPKHFLTLPNPTNLLTNNFPQIPPTLFTLKSPTLPNLVKHTIPEHFLTLPSPTKPTHK